MLMKFFSIFLAFIFVFFLNPGDANAQPSPTAKNGFVLRTILEGHVSGWEGRAVTGPVDFDNDGWNEFVVLCRVPDAEVKLFEAVQDNIYTQRSIYDITGTVHFGPGTRGLTIGNVDGDPEPEIVVGIGVSQHRVIILDVNPTTLEITKLGETPSPAENPTSIGIIGDSDNDNNPEFVVGNIEDILIAGVSLQLYEWNGLNWSIINEMGYAAGVDDIKIGNVDDDPQNEVVLMAQGRATGAYAVLGIVEVMDGQFHPNAQILNNVLTNMEDNNLAIIGDIDQNGKNEIVFGVKDYDKIYVFEHIQDSVYNTDEPAGVIELGNNPSALAVGDFDADGEGEIYVATTNPNGGVGLRYWKHTGAEGDFSITSFDTAVTVFDGIGNFSEVKAIKYFDGLNDRLDNDIYPDIVLVTAPISSNPEIYVIEAEPFTGITTDVNGVPEQVILQQNFPNPFNSSTTIRYSLNNSSDVVLKIYNMVGQEVRNLVNENQSPGEKSVKWDGTDGRGNPVGSGIYLCRLETENYSKSLKMLLLR